MSNTIGWGKAAENNTIGYGDGKDNSTNGWGSAYENSWSGETLLEVLLTAPVNVSAPVVSGIASVGSVLTTNNGTWDNEPTSYTYQWKRNGSNILSATANTYTVVAADVSQSITCTVTAINDAGSASATSNTITPTWETDAQAFITAAAITNPTQQSAVNQLVVDLKGYGVWTKMKALYPFVGGTASTHKFNLKNPLDTDAAFRLVFSGGWTHSANGSQPNGTNGYADTKLNEANVLTNNNEHISIYSRTNIDGLFCDIGIINGSIESNIFSKYSNVFYPRIQNTNNGILNNTSSLGHFISNRISSTEIRARQNGVLKLINSSFLGKSNSNFFIGLAGGLSLYYSPRQYAFASIGDGLTDAETLNFYTAVQNFQVALSRNV
jgi:hypothetical protein